MRIPAVLRTPRDLHRPDLTDDAPAALERLRRTSGPQRPLSSIQHTEHISERFPGGVGNGEGEHHYAMAAGFDVLDELGDLSGATVADRERAHRTRPRRRAPLHTRHVTAAGARGDGAMIAHQLVDSLLVEV